MRFIRHCIRSKAYDIKRKFTTLRLKERKNSAHTYIYIYWSWYVGGCTGGSNSHRSLGSMLRIVLPQSVAIDAQARSPAPEPLSLSPIWLTVANLAKQQSPDTV